MGTFWPTHHRMRSVWLLAALLAVLTWAYWPGLVQMVRRWSQDPQYTHGYVVPLFAAIVLWFRRDRFPTGGAHVSWLGVPVLLLAGIQRLAGSLLSYEWLAAGSLLPALVGVALLAVGPAVTRWAWPVAGFLVFVLPWPWQFDHLLTYPLRHIATVCSTWALQTIGFPAVPRGNIIVINQLEVGVVEACSGLGMLMTFFALSAAVALVVERPVADRAVLFLSAVPVGVLMNVVRITVTVVLFELANPELAQVVFHDVAGWVMMPLALVVLGLELWFLDRLRVPIEQARPLPLAAPPSTEARGPVPDQLSRPEANEVLAGADRSLANRGRLLANGSTADGSL